MENPQTIVVHMTPAEFQRYEMLLKAHAKKNANQPRYMKAYRQRKKLEKEKEKEEIDVDFILKNSS